MTLPDDVIERLCVAFVDAQNIGSDGTRSDIYFVVRDTHRVIIRALLEKLSETHTITPRAPEPEPEIRLNDDGSVDEIFAQNASVHIEQMDSNAWYIGIGTATKYLQIWLRGKRAVKLHHEITDETKRKGAKLVEE